MEKISLLKIITTASEAYSVDGEVIQHFKKERNVGDDLAKFVSQELKEVYDEDASKDDNVSESVRVMSRAIEELERVRDALDKL